MKWEITKVLQQSESDTKLLQGDTGILSTSTGNSTALVGLKAVTRHRLNCLLCLQGSEKQRGSPWGGQARQGCLCGSVCLPAPAQSCYTRHGDSSPRHFRAPPLGNIPPVGGVTTGAPRPQLWLPSRPRLHRPAGAAPACAASSRLPATSQPGSQPREGQGLPMPPATLPGALGGEGSAFRAGCGRCALCRVRLAGLARGGGIAPQGSEKRRPRVSPRREEGLAGLCPRCPLARLPRLTSRRPGRRSPPRKG